MALILPRHINSFNDIPDVFNIGGKQVESYSYKCCDQRRAEVTINPTTAVPTNVLSGAQLDFRFENQADRIAQTVYLRINWVNSDPAVPCVVATPEAQINQIQIYSDNGSTLLYQSTNNVEAYLLSNLLMDLEEQQNSAPYRGTDAVYTNTAVTAPPATSGWWYIPIAPNFWKSTHIRPYAINGNILIRVFFNTAAQNIISGAITTPEVVLRCAQYYESAPQKQLMVQRARLPKDIWYYAPQRQIETITLAPGVPYNLRLSGIMGVANCLMFVVRPIGNIANPSLQFAFTRMLSFEVLDDSNQSLTGYAPTIIPESIIDYGHQVRNLFITYVNFHWVSFSQMPVHDMFRGTMNGLVEFKGFHNLRLTPMTTLTGGSYQVTVVVPCIETLYIENASVRTTRT